ncbi:uncharacterized protein M6B38_360915 [Iris pallida]|uniref:Uncharacterized protein n=1 Tax=Iris pallida TaxID=29817 RepID=A0AAX6GLU1_IRIPA|nr:uncharacterized protein M6B38_168840 [Iris pallida]KAJ6829285.1 uncharacterized protein M6B38_360915 [Iris pallida]
MCIVSMLLSSSTIYFFLQIHNPAPSDNPGRPSMLRRTHPDSIRILKLNSCRPNNGFPIISPSSPPPSP